MAVTPRPSATLALLREAAEGIEVFMVRRHAETAFMPDVFVFPGGSVQESDRQAERLPGLCAPGGEGPTALGSGFRVAALRECFEEAGVLPASRLGTPLAIRPEDVARFAGYRNALNGGAMSLAEIAAREGLTLATDTLLHWAHWITPETFPRRFDTHFFLVSMPEAQEAAHDQLETTEGIWISPEAALSSHEGDRFPLVLATIHQLRALSGLRSVAEARTRFSGQPVRTIRPVLDQDGAPHLPPSPEE